MSDMIKPDKIDSRICFAIYLFYDEAVADEFAKDVRSKGLKYNGGYSHGRQCDRDKTWDQKDDEGRQMYAVTT